MHTPTVWARRSSPQKVSPEPTWHLDAVDIFGLGLGRRSADAETLAASIPSAVRILRPAVDLTSDITTLQLQTGEFLIAMTSPELRAGVSILRNILREDQMSPYDFWVFVCTCSICIWAVGVIIVGGIEGAVLGGDGPTVERRRDQRGPRNSRRSAKPRGRATETFLQLGGDHRLARPW